MRLPRFTLRDLFWLVVVAPMPFVFQSPSSGDDAAKPPLLEAEDLNLRIAEQKPFDMSTVPEKLRQLEGKPVEIRGYMYPGFARRMEQFVLTVETQGKPATLGFGSPPPLEYCAFAKLKSGQTVSFTRSTILVRGVLRIRPIAGGDTTDVFLVLEDAEVQVVSPRPGFHNSIEGGC